MGAAQDARMAQAEERREMVVRMREVEGKNFYEIGEVFGISHAWACEIYHRAVKLREERALGLSARATRIVKECGHSVEELIDRLARSEREVEALLLRRIGCHQPQAREIIAWLRIRGESDSTAPVAIG